jgi:hypothetical protein
VNLERKDVCKLSQELKSTLDSHTAFQKAIQNPTLEDYLVIPIMKPLTFDGGWDECWSGVEEADVIETERGDLIAVLLNHPEGWIEPGVPDIDWERAEWYIELLVRPFQKKRNTELYEFASIDENGILVEGFPYYEQGIVDSVPGNTWKSMLHYYLLVEKDDPRATEMLRSAFPPEDVTWPKWEGNETD